MFVVDKKILRCSYVIFIIFWAIGDIKGNLNDDVKYLFLGVSLLFAYLPIIVNEKKEKLNLEKLKIALPFTVFSVVITILAMVFTPSIGKYASKTLIAVFFSILYITAIENVEKDGDGAFYFDTMFYCFLVGFLVKYSSTLNMSNIMKISFTDSYSPFESDYAMYFTFLFLYYMVKKKYMKAIISFFIGYLAFKRLNLVFMFFILVVALFLKDRKTPKWLTISAGIFFVLSPIVINFLSSNEFTAWYDSTHEVSFSDFTMGRLWQVQEILKVDQPLYGVGAIKNYFVTNNYYIVDFHCDLLRVCIELTPIALVLLVVQMLRLSKDSIYAFLWVCFILGLMFSSTCIDGFMNWFMTYLCCQYMGKEVARTKIEKNRQPKKQIDWRKKCKN